MRSFFLPDGKLNDTGTIVLPELLRHHLTTVLRLQPGTEFRLFDGSGVVADAVLEDNGRAQLRRLTNLPLPPCRIRLIQGLPKGDRTELILQKGTELGAGAFHLVTMARSQVRLKRESRQQQRWEKIIQEAARQSGQYHLPSLDCGDSLQAALAGDDAELKLMLWEQSTTPLTAVLEKKELRRISVIVGPEGGMTDEEASQAQAHGYQAVSLGPRILRTETAGLAIIAVLQYLYGDLSVGSA